VYTAHSRFFVVDALYKSTFTYLLSYLSNSAKFSRQERRAVCLRHERLVNTELNMAVLTRWSERSPYRHHS